MNFSSKTIGKSLKQIVDDNCYRLIFADATADEYRAVTIKNFNWKSDNEEDTCGKISEWFAGNNNTKLCHEEDVERLAQFSDIDFLRKSLTDNIGKSFRIVYRRKFCRTDKLFSTFVMEFFPDVDEDGHIVATITIRNLTDETSLNDLQNFLSAIDAGELTSFYSRQNRMEEDMMEAFTTNQFKVYYQPKHDTRSGQLVGAEALIRWIHPELGFLSPAEFIPLFERTRFICHADYYVWRRTCQNLRSRLDRGEAIVPISVNISKIDFDQDDFMDYLLKPVLEYGIDPKYLHLEVTESIFSERLDDLSSTLQKCRESGFKIEMDDFGTGYSSLNILSRLPLDVMKLDMSFMNEIDDEKKLWVLSSCINLAKTLNMKTVAEGVETSEQFSLLRKLGCDRIQGYYFSKPLPEEEFRDYLDRYIGNNPPELPDENSKTKQGESAVSDDRKTVLIVDDVKLNREILYVKLRKKFKVIEAENGFEAIEIMVKNKNIDIVLMDIVMPKMDGFETIKQLKERNLIHQPFIMISSEDPSKLVSRAFESGAADFVTRPEGIKTIAKRVEGAIARYEQKQRETRFYNKDREPIVCSWDEIPDILKECSKDNDRGRIVDYEKCIEYILIDDELKENPVSVLPQQYFEINKGAGGALFLLGYSEIFIDSKKYYLQTIRAVNDGDMHKGIGLDMTPAAMFRRNKMLYVDRLTGAFSRNYLMEYLMDEKISALAMIDMDYFKQVNDNFGHVQGDRVLQLIVGTIIDSIRNDDYLVRYGGDEFLLVMTDISRENAGNLLERIRSKVEKVIKKSFEDIKCTVSIGAVMTDECSLESIIKADEMLYEAKKERNKVIFNQNGGEV